MSSIHALYLNHSGKACVKRWPLDFEIRLGDLIYLSSGHLPTAEVGSLERIHISWVRVV